MKKYLDITLFFVFFFPILTCGIILLSQGFTFARWDGFSSIETYINSHAYLLALAGIGLFAGALWCLRLEFRLLEIEKAITSGTGSGARIDLLETRGTK